MRRTANICTGCGNHDRWFGEIFDSEAVPRDVPLEELLDFEMLMRLYGEGPKRPLAKNEPRAVLRLSRTHNVIANFHSEAVQCLFCPTCGQVSIVPDPTSLKVI